MSQKWFGNQLLYSSLPETAPRRRLFAVSTDYNSSLLFLRQKQLERANRTPWYRGTAHLPHPMRCGNTSVNWVSVRSEEIHLTTLKILSAWLASGVGSCKFGEGPITATVTVLEVGFAALLLFEEGHWCCMGFQGSLYMWVFKDI